MPGKPRRLAFVRDLFFWIGVACAAASIVAVAANNTLFISRLEHRTVPLSWAFAGAAVIALLIAEQLHWALTPSQGSLRGAAKRTPPDTHAKVVTPAEAEGHVEHFPHSVRPA
jgi:hypothetical protein